MAFDASYFSRILKVKRAERSWSQEDLAKASGVKLSSIKRYEAMKNEPSYNTVCMLAEALRCSTEDFKPKRRPFAATHRS